MDQKCTNGTRFSTKLEWEHGWKSCIANSKDWRSENVNAIELNCKVVKKLQPSPPLLSSKKFCIPQPSDSIFGTSSPTPPTPFNKDGKNYFCFLSFFLFLSFKRLQGYARMLELQIHTCHWFLAYTILSYTMYFFHHITQTSMYIKKD